MWCVLLFAVFFVGTATVAAAWPLANEWIPIYAPEGSGVQDPGGQADTTGNGNNGTDIVGDATNAAAYIYNDGIDLYFRLRLDADPSQGGGLSAFGWGVLIDTDLDAHDYEFMLMLDGIANPDEIYLAKNVVQQNIDDPSDKPEQIEWIKPATAGTDYIVSQAPTSFTGDPDYFLDFRVPYDIFLLSLGANESSLLRYFFGTSQSAQQLSADLVGSSIYDGVSDFTLPTGKRPTTGSIQFAADLAGNGEATAFYPGETLYIKVVDDDQNSLVATAESINVALTTPSGDIEVVILTETGNDTGIFTGSMVTGQSGIITHNGILQTIPVEFITASYLDEADALNNTNQPRTDTIRANPTADLGIAKTASNHTPNNGETITFTLTLTNHGPSAANGIQVRDVLAPGLTYLGDSGGGTYNPATGVWIVATLGISSSASLQIQAAVTAPPLATIDNTAAIIATAYPDFNTTNNSDTVTLAVTGADLAVTKTVAVTNPAVGGNLPKTGDEVTYTITVINRGSHTATGIVIRDLLAAGQLTWLSDTSGGAYNPGSGNWDIGTLTNGASASMQIVARVDAPAGATVDNSASVLAVVESDPVPGNNSATATLFVDAADLRVTKTVNDANPDVGDIITYTIRLENLYGSAAGNLQIRDQLPSGLEFVGATPTIGSYDSVSGIWNLGAFTLNPGGFETLAINARVKAGTAGQVITNTVSIDSTNKFDPNPEDDDVSIQIRYLDLAIDKTTSTTSPNNGSTITFTITVTNNGPIAATGVRIYDKLPVQLYNDVSGGDRNVAVTTSFSDPTDSYSLTTGVWDVGALAVGASATMTINATVKVPNGGSSTFFNIARVEACDQADPISGNDADSVLLGVTGTDIEVVSKTVSNSTPSAPVAGVNDRVTYTIVVRNNGPNAATNLTISEALPAGLGYVAGSATENYTPPAGKTDSTAYADNTGIWTLGYRDGGNTVLPAGTTVTLTLQADVTAAAGIVITNNALVNSLSGADTNPANNSKSAIITVSGSDLQMAKAVSNGTPTVGANITYTLTVTNLGPFPVTDIDVTDLLPVGLTYLSHTAGASYDPMTGLWDLGGTSLSIGASAALDIVATVNATAAGQSIVNTALISNRSTPDPVAANDRASVTVVVQESDLSLIKTANDVTPDETTNVIFTLTLGNNGPHDAGGIQVTDLLPAGLEFVAAAPAQGSVATTANPDGTTEVRWDLTGYTLPKTQFVILTITARAALGTGGTTLTNTASISAAGNYDPNSGNDTASLAVTPNKVYIDLAVTKSVDNSAPNEGDTVAYTVTLSNHNPTYAASGVQVTDLLPAQIAYVSAAPAAGTSYDETTGLWAVDTVAGGGSKTLTITARPAVGAGGTTLTNTAIITASDYDDPVAGNNSASVDITPAIVPMPSLTILKFSNKATARPGEAITYTVQIANTGTGPANVVVVRDGMNPFLTLVPDPFGNGTPFRFTEGVPASGVTPDMTGFSIAPTGVWQLPMAGSMAAGGNFTLEYQARVK